MLMYWHYLTFAWRRIRREKKINLIRIANLSIGLASGLVIFLVVNYMLTFDRYHPEVERSYWVVTDLKKETTLQTDAAPRPLAEVLRRDYAFVESAVKLETFFGRTISIPNGQGGWEKKFNESRNMCFTESQYFDLFGVEWLSGDPHKALATPNAIVISERYAEKYFQTTLALGKTVRLDNRVNLTVTGIIKNPPSNTQLRYDGLVSYATLANLEPPTALNDWLGLQSMCFVRLRKGISPNQLTTALAAVQKKHLPAAQLRNFSYHVLPLTELNHARSGMAPRPILFALMAVGLLLVMAACINYVNLATAQALQRAHETGVRKVVGSNRWQLIKQFMTETALLTFAAVLLALILTQLALPVVNDTLTQQDETLHPNISVLDVFTPNALLWFVPLVLGVVFLAGFYPSWVLSGFNPIKALAGRLTRAKGGLTIRRTLITGQFLLTQLFLIVVLVITSQLRHMQKADWGFRTDNKLVVWLPKQGAIPYERLRKSWLDTPGVQSVTFANEPPVSPYNRPSPFSYHTSTEPESFEILVRTADEHYLSAFGLSLLKGRNFSKKDTSRHEVLVNETFVKQLGIASSKEVIGKPIRIKGTEHVIAGVVKDFRTGNLHEPIRPIALVHDLSHSSMAVLTFAPSAVSSASNAVEAIWNNTFPEDIYRRSYLNELLDSFTKMEQLLAGFVQIFAFIAIAMNCLGLYGLVTFMAEKRAKEIGVRRMLGARTEQLLWVFGREFSRLLLVGFAVAAPLGWWLTSGWLQQYAYRIQMSGWFLVATLGLMVAITAATIIGHAMKAVATNPVKHLRAE
ncbi:ABC transporter permease [Runella sp. SP2]|uniref:ABC transporter permease n=1 Tax=Runella sp. SP2 TaxID=2268026 RepID=UPI001E5DBBD8|nr:ABC transporter permease [Runella sp. SP2]